jgi:hypothetical protein
MAYGFGYPLTLLPHNKYRRYVELLRSIAAPFDNNTSSNTILFFLPDTQPAAPNAADNTILLLLTYMPYCEQADNTTQ